MKQGVTQDSYRYCIIKYLSCSFSPFSLIAHVSSMFKTCHLHHSSGIFTYPGLTSKPQAVVKLCYNTALCGRVLVCDLMRK